MSILLLMLILILIIGTVLIALYSANNKKSVQFEQISSNNVTQRFCDKCGAELKGNNPKFCEKCGAEIKN